MKRSDTPNCNFLIVYLRFVLFMFFYIQYRKWESGDPEVLNGPGS